MQNPDTIPNSYYLMAIGDTRKLGTKSNSALKIQERQIAFQQDPIGWLFFAFDNVDHLIRTLSQSFGNVDYALISPSMEKIYHMDPIAGHLPLSDCSPARMAREVDRMNRQLEKLVAQNMLHLTAANHRYTNFVRDGKVGYEKHGEWTRSTRRETVPNPATDLMAQQEGFIFRPKTENSAVMPQPAKDRFADFPTKALINHGRVRWE